MFLRVHGWTFSMIMRLRTLVVVLLNAALLGCGLFLLRETRQDEWYLAAGELPEKPGSSEGDNRACLAER